MSTLPIPILFDPIFKPRPWGGRRLATLFNKALPADVPIGESWELSDLPGSESRVRGGPLAGRTVGELVRAWGRNLLGDANLIHGRFPLLIKFLDARESLSVQVHPRPEAENPLGTKDEAWFVIAGEPGSKLYIGLKPGVTADDMARAAGTIEMVDLLRAWDAQPGQGYYLPGGTPHALGAGLVVAEVQTPADVTYRMYDWGRVGLDGRPRPLHIEQALANVRYDVPVDVICQPGCDMQTRAATASGALRCGRFDFALRRYGTGWRDLLDPGMLRALIILSGSGHLSGDGGCSFSAGDVVLVPAHSDQLNLEVQSDSEWLEVTVPGRDG